MNKRPKIGMIANCAFPEDLVRGLLKAGAQPVLIPIQADEEMAAAYLELVDGLLVPGGEDVAPSLYGQEPCAQVVLSLRDKDLFEIALIKAAIAQKKPILGICRGQQIINVALGGDLIQDIPTQVEGGICHRQIRECRSELFHRITISPDSWLREMFGVDEMDVNSLHHQSIGRLADGLRAVAHTSDGIIEGIQSEDGLIYCVQFHPECLFDRYDAFLKPFSFLVELAGKQL